MNLYPMDFVRSAFAVAHDIIPPMTIGIRGLERSIDVDTSLQSSRIPATYAEGVGSKRLKPRSNHVSAKMWRRLDGLSETHRSFDATAIATSALARSLKSVRPPQPASNGRSVDGSRAEMSCTVPESRWK